MTAGEGGANLVNHGGLEVEEDAAGDVLASAGLGEEGVERIIAAADGLVGGHLAVGLDAVLKAVELPAGWREGSGSNARHAGVMRGSARTIPGLDTSLADVDGDNFAHF